jgi:DNA-binding MarR family transcriptional regulator
VTAHLRLRMWLRLLATVRRTEGTLREFVRLRHHTTLPRFDVMAALHRCPDGVTMSELSRLLLVSNGNATAVVARLEADGLVRRTALASDRRSVQVALTEAGLVAFEGLARDHEAEVDRIFAHVSEEELDMLTTLLKRIGGSHGHAR